MKNIKHRKMVYNKDNRHTIMCNSQTFKLFKKLRKHGDFAFYSRAEDIISEIVNYYITNNKIHLGE